MLRTFELTNYKFDPNDHWSDLLASVSWAMHSTYHTVLQATPGQLVFGCDMLLNLRCDAKWDALKKHCQTLINSRCKTENCPRIDCDWKVGDEALIKLSNINRKLNVLVEGLHDVPQVFANGTVLMQRGAVRERVNMRCLTPCLTDNA